MQVPKESFISEQILELSKREVRAFILQIRGTRRETYCAFLLAIWA